MTPKTAKSQTQIAISRDDQISQIYWLVPMGFHWLRAGRGFLTSFRSGRWAARNWSMTSRGSMPWRRDVAGSAGIGGARHCFYTRTFTRTAGCCGAMPVQPRKNEASRGGNVFKIDLLHICIFVFVSVFVTIRDKGQHKFLWWKKISFLMKA